MSKINCPNLGPPPPLGGEARRRRRRGGVNCVPESAAVSITDSAPITDQRNGCGTPFVARAAEADPRGNALPAPSVDWPLRRRFWLHAREAPDRDRRLAAWIEE